MYKAGYQVINTCAHERKTTKKKHTHTQTWWPVDLTYIDFDLFFFLNIIITMFIQFKSVQYIDREQNISKIN